MKRIIVNMQNFIFTDAICHALTEGGDNMDVRNVERPDEIHDMCRLVQPHIVIMEVTAFSPYTFDERIETRNRLMSRHPECKIVFACNEKADNEIAEKVKLAKIDGLIDQFIYDSISVAYMTALVDSL